MYIYIYIHIYAHIYANKCPKPKHCSILYAVAESFYRACFLSGGIEGLNWNNACMRFRHEKLCIFRTSYMHVPCAGY